MRMWSDRDLRGFKHVKLQVAFLVTPMPPEGRKGGTKQKISIPDHIYTTSYMIVHLHFSQTGSMQHEIHIVWPRFMCTALTFV